MVIADHWLRDSYSIELGPTRFGSEEFLTEEGLASDLLEAEESIEVEAAVADLLAADAVGAGWKSAVAIDSAASHSLVEVCPADCLVSVIVPGRRLTAWIFMSVLSGDCGV